MKQLDYGTVLFRCSAVLSGLLALQLNQNMTNIKTDLNNVKNNSVARRLLDPSG